MKNQEKKVFIIAIVLNIIVLVLYKYLGFLEINFNKLGAILDWNYPIPLLKFIVPLGLSFLVFTMISYLIEVKRGKIEAEKNVALFFLYACWFPKVMSGPIERPYNLLPQFRGDRKIDYQDITKGLQQILWGFFLKLVIADRLAVITSPVFDHPAEFHGFSIALAATLYSFQILADFAGYTDIALGVSLLFGIKLSPNFRAPYFSRSIQVFWTRWHITLSSWLRDYLFLPFSYAISRKLPNDKYLHVRADYWIYGIASLLTMLICGFWHGAGWTFIVWGLLHGFYLLSGFVLKKWKKKLNNLMHWKKDNMLRSAWDIGFTFILVSFAWIFFRSENLHTSFTTIGGIFRSAHWLNAGIVADITEFNITLSLLIAWLLWEWFHKSNGSLPGFSTLKTSLRWILYFILFWAILIFGLFGNERFIYFQF